MVKILKGKEVSNKIIQNCAQIVSERITKNGIAPKIVVVCLENNSSNESYIKGIEKKAGEAGFVLKVEHFDSDTNVNKLKDKIINLNNNNKVDGILLMRPFPAEFKNFENELCELIDINKDIDAAKSLSVAGSFLGTQTHCPCTAEACVKILDYYNIDISGKHIVVIGRSMVVGKPLANLLINRDATVTICHSKTKNIDKIARSADIVITATGTANKFNNKYFSKNQVVIDAGINWDSNSNKIVGDVDFESVKNKVRAITPVPGGVGTVTTSVLLEHAL